jgi:hypothetical protein
MRRLLYVCVAAVAILTCFSGWLAWQYGAAVSPRGTATLFMPNPEDGKVADGSYTNDYFSLAYRLPQGWIAGEAGPDPSESGYYVLAELLTQSQANGTILIAAQDKFFGTNTRGSAADIARDFQHAMSHIDGMTIDRDLTEVKVADHLLYRVDYSGVGLYRAAISTENRCHIVSFNITTRDRNLLAALVHSVDSASFAATGKGGSPPPCIQDYAAGGNILHKVNPKAVGPKFTPIPVRIIADADGNVRHVHVIHGTPEQRRSIEEALYQWKLKPYEIDGRPSPVETGLLFKFTAGSTVEVSGEAAGEQMSRARSGPTPVPGLSGRRIHSRGSAQQP